MTPSSKPSVFSEKDWNNASVEDLEKNGVNASGMTKYRVSKIFAEKGKSGHGLWPQFFDLLAAWEFYEKNKANVNWELVVINPPFVSCCFGICDC